MSGDADATLADHSSRGAGVRDALSPTEQTMTNDEGPLFDDATLSAMCGSALRLAGEQENEAVAATIRRLVRHLHRERMAAGPRAISDAKPAKEAEAIRLEDELARFKRADVVMADALRNRDATIKQAREWWERQGRFLAPRGGDDKAWEEFAKSPIPRWVSA